MTIHTPIFSEEIEQLLREIAANPHSRLLRVPRKRVQPTFLECSRAVGLMAAGLTSAERELLAVHREEVAFLLRQACWLKLLDGDQDKQTIGRHISKDEEIPTCAWMQVQRRAEELVNFEEHQDKATSQADLLSSLVQAESARSVSVAELATAAHRLVPTDQSRIYAAMQLTAEGRFPAAIGIYEALLHWGASGLTRSAALSNAAFCYEGTGNMTECIRLNEAALQSESQVVVPAMNLLLLGLLRDEAKTAIIGTTALRERSVSEVLIADDFLTQLRVRARRARATIPRPSPRTLHDLETQANPLARRIIDALR